MQPPKKPERTFQLNELAGLSPFATLIPSPPTGGDLVLRILSTQIPHTPPAVRNEKLRFTFRIFAYPHALACFSSLNLTRKKLLNFYPIPLVGVAQSLPFRFARGTLSRGEPTRGFVCGPTLCDLCVHCGEKVLALVPVFASTKNSLFYPFLRSGYFVCVPLRSLRCKCLGSGFSHKKAFALLCVPLRPLR